MKADERHELKENDLASWVYAVPAFFSKYGSYLLFAVAIALLGYNLYGWYQRTQLAAVQSAWSQLNAAEQDPTNPPAKLRALISSCDLREVQARAYLELGNFYQRIAAVGVVPQGVDLKITPEEAAASAVKEYQKVLSDYPDQKMIVVLAKTGLGKAYEDLGQWSDAKQQHEKLMTSTDPLAPAFAALARQRLDHLAEWQQPVTVGPPTPPATATAPAPVHKPLDLDFNVGPPAPGK